jgi:hypothetical protein
MWLRGYTSLALMDGLEEPVVIIKRRQLNIEGGTDTRSEERARASRRIR